MNLTGPARRAMLTGHVIASVGWLGAVASFAAISVVALVSAEPATVRGAYAVMEQAGWWVMLPLSVASLITGVVQGLGTRWGVLRHYWVVVKLVINVVASVVLVMYMQTLVGLADEAAAATDPTSVASPSPVVHAGGALVLLVCATILSIYKPRGLTKRGHRAVSRASSVEEPVLARE